MNGKLVRNILKYRKFFCQFLFVKGSGNRFSILTNATPQLFKKLCIRILNGVKNKKNKIIFVKSWNEWGEGNYMEPDLKFGKGYINALAEAKKEIYP